MKKILITGSSGYIGSHLCDMLSGEYEVHGLDIKDPQVEIEKFYKLDINKQFLIEGVEFDSVVHLAALTSVPESQERPISYYITNLNGTMNVLNKVKTKNFVMPTNVDGLFYNLNKARESGEFTIYGNDYPNTVDGTCVRDYVHVEEVCHALRMAIEKPANNTECLGHGIGYTVKEMVNKFQAVNKCEFEIKYGPRRDGDIEYYVLEDVSPYMKNLYSIEDLLKI